MNPNIKSQEPIGESRRNRRNQVMKHPEERFFDERCFLFEDFLEE